MDTNYVAKLCEARVDGNRRQHGPLYFGPIQRDHIGTEVFVGETEPSLVNLIAGESLEIYTSYATYSLPDSSVRQSVSVTSTVTAHHDYFELRYAISNDGDTQTYVSIAGLPHLVLRRLEALVGIILPPGGYIQGAMRTQEVPVHDIIRVNIVDVGASTLIAQYDMAAFVSTTGWGELLWSGSGIFPKFPDSP